MAEAARPISLRLAPRDIEQPKGADLHRVRPLTSVVRELIPAERLTPGKAQRKATTALQAMNQTATAPGLTVDFRQREWGLERR